MAGFVEGLIIRFGVFDITAGSATGMPKGIEVLAQRGGPTAGRHNVVAGNPEFLDLIF